MVKASLRKCSHCGHNGNCSRTCNGKGIKLFGVKINVVEDDYANRQNESIRKSKSMGNLETCNGECNVPDDADGYVSDGLIHESSGAKTAHERRKGKPWSEEEHRSFLLGLEKLGKGDWKGISKNFVHSRTPTQVASHAQKYFLRLMTATERKKRRTSVFDIPLDEMASTSKLPSASNSHNAPISPQATTAAQVKTCERPPLSPRATSHAVSDLHRPRYMFGVRDHGQGLPACTPPPNVSFLPIWNFSNQKFAPSPTTAAKYTRGPAVAQPPSAAFSRFPSYIPPLTGPANEAAIKDGLDLGVQALTL
ncbi:probable transcription factor At5g61620 [Coffea arabica]|uniref:Probable transcription factor At5g61620 n=1 Tax=Coffea arabica TaxID=13443 RepID=A0A6P6VKW2_COFAR|nr:probable transcription factor At5g61620 [Coffea arabica]